MLLAMLLAAADTGGWQYTRWDMSPDEVSAAAATGVVPFSHKDADRAGSKSKLLTVHEANGTGFNVVFRFSDANKLNGVVLLPKSYADCRPILEQLKAAYGKPEDESFPEYAMEVRWRADASKSIVRFFSMMRSAQIGDPAASPYCEVEYTPTTTPEALGF